ncbi:Ribonuclease E inhibitor RraA/Dimethylmenaquinone methyltransferase [Niveomyces insectorum RCEF 264]|uniref:Ribonuclease E inhibitor RraA/Dimethylmenaquinone methyltransferase n=1 Tax=Niveomyces insectorum RCEF 264 TaxID=1081102 RepID=A0A167SNV1_9HYPO|nr:Ribonuclease E inhibitor RraA/Dimethylmenaquinone methyltransferase [Niveomyces insectorum RCEF 264]
MTPETASIVERLRKWSSCDVADGLSKLGRVHGGFLEGLVMYAPQFQRGATKVVGPVMTVKFAAKSDKTAPKLQGNYIDQIPSGAVVFLSQPLPHINACYGGMMSLRAQHLGAAGVLIDGRLRDLQEHQDLNFPVFARGVGTTAGGAVCFPSEINVPVRLQSTIQEADATVHPGDFIVADRDGVVCVPAGLVEQVLEAIPALAAADEKCAAAIRQGVSVQEAFATYRGK